MDDHTASFPAGAPRFRHASILVIALGVLVLLAFDGASAFDIWHSYRHTVHATNRELSNVANALGEQTALSWQAVDLLLVDIARWYRDDISDIPQSNIAHKAAPRLISMCRTAPTSLRNGIEPIPACS
jgi:hypothetical protein